MKQNTFETRQRAELLLNEAMAIWQQSDKAEYLEGLQTDTIFRMLLNAMAYQANEFDSDVEQVKDDILEEFKSMISVGEAGKAIPATIAVETTPVGKVHDVTIDADSSFRIGTEANGMFSFIPLLRSRVVNASVVTVSRLDSRRWLVRMHLADGVTNLSGMTFAIADSSFHALRVNMVNNGCEVPLISPWDYANQPMSNAFSLNTLLYNRSQAVSAANARASMMPYAMYSAADLFARQTISTFIIDEMDDFEPTDTMELMFEFEGINDDFSFNMDNFHINVVLLVNAEIGRATISNSSPVVRIAGNTDGNNHEEQFLHLLQPSQEQIYGTLPLQVRRVNADRFNRGRLAKLLYNLISKYDSDYYAFQEFGSTTVEKTIQGLRKGLNTLLNSMESKTDRSFEGVYLMIADNGKQTTIDTNGNEVDASLDVEYLTTNGAAANVLAEAEKLFVMTPENLDNNKTATITKLQNGFDEVYDQKAVEMENRYFLSTEDRIVTPADVKLFCYKELMTHFGVVRDLVKGIRIKHQQKDIGTFHTYETLVTISIVDNVFTRQAFAEKIAYVENYLGRMIQVRTNGIFPVSVIMKLI